MVTTDQSNNSKSAVRMALRLAKLRGCSLSVVQVNHIPKPFSWTTEAYDRFLKKSMAQLTAELSKFVSAICRSVGVVPIKFKSVILNSTDVVGSISGYAAEQKFDYLLIATRGAGWIKEIFGTHTSRLLHISSIPVIVVPSQYKYHPIERIIYATDLQNFENELARLIEFAQPLHAGIEMLSLRQDFEGMSNPEELQQQLSHKFHYPISYRQVSRNIERSLIEDLHVKIDESRSSMLALFSHHDRKGFERILFPSNAEQYSFYARIPLLVLSKQDQGGKQTVKPKGVVKDKG